MAQWLVHWASSVEIVACGVFSDIQLRRWRLRAPGYSPRAKSMVFAASPGAQLLPGGRAGEDFS